MARIITAFILGLSAEGILICPFFAFGLTLSNKIAGLRFLLGRIMGLICFGIIVCLLGRSVHIDMRVANLIFGIFIIGLGLYTILGKLEGRHHRTNVEGRVGFGLGLFRGMLNPGRKFIYLIPLLVGMGIVKGAVISLVYALSSSVYLLVGFLSAGLLGKLMPYRHQIRIAGGFVLMILGVFYAWKARGLIL